MAAESPLTHQAPALAFDRLLEPFGLPPIAGRIYGCLLLEGDALSLDDLVDRTGSSKTSVSQNARLLERDRWVQRVSRLKSRKDYYALSSAGGTRPVELLMEHLAEFANVYRAVCDQGHARSAAARNHLRLCASLFDHLTSSVGGQLSEWRSRVGS